MNENRDYSYDLTILMPAIRADRWLEVYKSIEASFSGTWQLIIITEKDPTKEFVDYLESKTTNGYVKFSDFKAMGIHNVIFLWSERSPMHKQQEALGKDIV